MASQRNFPNLYLLLILLKQKTKQKNPKPNKKQIEQKINKNKTTRSENRWQLSPCKIQKKNNNYLKPVIPTFAAVIQMRNIVPIDRWKKELSSPKAQKMNPRTLSSTEISSAQTFWSVWKHMLSQDHMSKKDLAAKR